MALPLLKGTISDYGYKSRGRVTLSTGKSLALRCGPDEGDARVPQPGDAVWCRIFYSPEGGIVVAHWAYE